MSLRLNSGECPTLLCLVVFQSKFCALCVILYNVQITARATCAVWQVWCRGTLVDYLYTALYIICLYVQRLDPPHMPINLMAVLTHVPSQNPIQRCKFHNLPRCRFQSQKRCCNTVSCFFCPNLNDICLRSTMLVPTFKGINSIVRCCNLQLECGTI